MSHHDPDFDRRERILNSLLKGKRRTILQIAEATGDPAPYVASEVGRMVAAKDLRYFYEEDGSVQYEIG